MRATVSGVVLNKPGWVPSTIFAGTQSLYSPASGHRWEMSDDAQVIDVLDASGTRLACIPVAACVLINFAAEPKRQPEPPPPTPAPVPTPTQSEALHRQKGKR